MEVIIAARLSQIGEGQEGIYSQDEDAQEWAEENGHTVVATVADIKSGKYAMWDRPNLKPWVTDPEIMARYQGVVAAKQDRLSREGFWDEVALRQWAERNGKTLFIVERNMQWPPDPAHYEDGVRRWNDGASDAREEWVRTSKRYRRMQKAKVARGSLTGRPTYGLMVIDAEGEDGRPIKTLAPKPGEAEVIREAKDRYLAGETIDAIVADFNTRGIPGAGLAKDPITRKAIKGTRCKWSARTLAGLLRNTASAGRRMNAAGKTILEYTGPITWDEHERLVARLDSRAHRKGISPGNVALLTSILIDQAGHPMTRSLGGGPRVRIAYYYCRKCGATANVRVDVADEWIRRYIEFSPIGGMRYVVTETIPGSDYRNEIGRLRQDRSELDDLAEDYEDRVAEITAEIRRLSTMRKADTTREIDTGETYAQRFARLDTPGQREILKRLGKVVYHDGQFRADFRITTAAWS